MAHIVVIGAGLGGVPAAFDLRKHLPKNHRVTAFVALPQIPPRNVTWSKKGKWVHLAKIAFEKYFLRKVRTGSLTPVYETYVLKALGVVSLKQRAS
jgi:monoamine oxidase